MRINTFSNSKNLQNDYSPSSRSSFENEKLILKIESLKLEINDLK